ncbi:MAG TPA: hypothetical protein VMT64_04245, partial [Candidatus Binataceae bacterium]|nr:hypothetical protein [Candidatus Binataceae bacterium]
MASRILWALLGALLMALALFIGAYLFISSGGVPMQTTATPLPLEKTIARMALRASFRRDADNMDPLPVSDDNLLSGAKAYSENCAGCHGSPGHPVTAFAKAMFPPPPQLFEANQMVTDDPEGVIFWKITNGI